MNIERKGEGGVQSPLVTREPASVDSLLAQGDKVGAKSLMNMEEGQMAPVRPQPMARLFDEIRDRQTRPEIR